MDFDVWYRGDIIANEQAGDEQEALRNARAVWGQLVTVSETRGSAEAAAKARDESIRIAGGR